MKTSSIIVGIGGILVIGGLYWHFAGYSLVYSEYDATKRAEEIVNDGLPVETCLRIKTIVPTYPPVGSFRRTCIRKYAELMQDPLACKFLMPSRYGLSCVGYAEDPYPCSYVRNEIFWEENGLEKKTNVEECNTNKDRGFNEAACCHIAEVSTQPDKNDCTDLQSNEQLFDQCMYRLSFKKRDPASCAEISSQRTKDACEVMARAVRDDPSIID